MREGALLAHNLIASFGGGPMIPYRPQTRSLSILNSADEKASSNYFGVHSRLEMWLKDRIDRRFMTRFQRLEKGAPS